MEMRHSNTRFLLYGKGDTPTFIAKRRHTCWGYGLKAHQGFPNEVSPCDQTFTETN
jgi:hypothetical protein